MFPCSEVVWGEMMLWELQLCSFYENVMLPVCQLEVCETSVTVFH
jgi:hypothetical protein